jgi:hypothetical protein
VDVAVPVIHLVPALSACGDGFTDHAGIEEVVDLASVAFGFCPPFVALAAGDLMLGALQP